MKEIYSKYQLIRKELKDFGAGLEDKKEIVVLSKIDLIESKGIRNQGIKNSRYCRFFRKKKRDFANISGNGEGIDDLKVD